MTQDEIIEMALSCGIGDPRIEFYKNQYEAFAKLVAQHERKNFCALLRQLHDSISLQSDPNGLKARGEA